MNYFTTTSTPLHKKDEKNKMDTVKKHKINKIALEVCFYIILFLIFVLYINSSKCAQRKQSQAKIKGCENFYGYLIKFGLLVLLVIYILFDLAVRGII